MKTFYEIDKEVSEAIDREYRNKAIAIVVLIGSLLLLLAVI